MDCFSKPGVYITHNATDPLNDIPEGNLSDYIQHPLEPQKALYYFLPHAQWHSPRPVHTLMWKGGVAL